MPSEKECNPVIFFPFTARSGAKKPFYFLLQPPDPIANKIESLIEALEEKKKLALGLTAVAATTSIGVVAYKEIKKRKERFAFSDEELEKFREMVEMNWEPIHHYALFRLSDEKDAKDITQEAFTRLGERFKYYKPLEGLDNPYSPLLYRIAANLINNLRRDNKRHKVFTESELVKDDSNDNLEFTHFIDQDLTPEEAVIAKQQIESLQEALDKLPYRYQLVLYLKSNTPLTDEEIGVVLGISKETTKSLIHRARKALKKVYKD